MVVRAVPRRPAHRRGAELRAPAPLRRVEPARLARRAPGAEDACSPSASGSARASSSTRSPSWPSWPWPSSPSVGSRPRRSPLRRPDVLSGRDGASGGPVAGPGRWAARPPSPTTSSSNGPTITTSHAAPAPVQTGAVHAKDVSVVVCAYTDERWDDLLAAVASLRAQTAAPARSSSSSTTTTTCSPALRATLPEASSRSPTPGSAASPARATAASRSPRGAVVAFLDDDAVAEPDWLERLLAAYARPARDRRRRRRSSRPGPAAGPRCVPGRVRLGRRLHLPRPAHDDRARCAT